MPHRDPSSPPSVLPRRGRSSPRRSRRLPRLRTRTLGASRCSESTIARFSSDLAPPDRSARRRLTTIPSQPPRAYRRVLTRNPTLHADVRSSPRSDRLRQEAPRSEVARRRAARGADRHELRGGIGVRDPRRRPRFGNLPHTEVPGATLGPGRRDLIVESIYEYGSRAGFLRLMRIFEDRKIPVTVFGAALALERNPEAARAIRDAGHEVCSHGWRWINFATMDESEERAQMLRAIASLERTVGERPYGWYCRYAPSLNTRRLVVEEGGFLYDSDAYNDDLPYWVRVGTKDHLVIPYTLDVNDMKFSVAPGFSAPSGYFEYMRDTFDVLYREGRTQPKMMSVGLHTRLAGAGPARAAAPRTVPGPRAEARRRMDLPARRNRAALDREPSAGLRFSRAWTSSPSWESTKPASTGVSLRRPNARRASGLQLGRAPRATHSRKTRWGTSSHGAPASAATPHRSCAVRISIPSRPAARTTARTASPPRCAPSSCSTPAASGRFVRSKPSRGPAKREAASRSAVWEARSLPV